MRTTVDIDDPILREVRRIGEAEGRSMGAVISELLAEGIAHRRKPQSPPPFQWASRPMRALINLDDKDAVYGLLDQDE